MMSNFTAFTVSFKKNVFRQLSNSLWTAGGGAEITGGRVLCHFGQLVAGLRLLVAEFFVTLDSW